jgi:hypothetical protein
VNITLPDDEYINSKLAEVNGYTNRINKLVVFVSKLQVCISAKAESIEQRHF